MWTRWQGLAWSCCRLSSNGTFIFGFLGGQTTLGISYFHPLGGQSMNGTFTFRFFRRTLCISYFHFLCGRSTHGLLNFDFLGIRTTLGIFYIFNLKEEIQHMVSLIFQAGGQAKLVEAGRHLHMLPTHATRCPFASPQMLAASHRQLGLFLTQVLIYFWRNH